jgi:molybdate transport system regulatory protein
MSYRTAWQMVRKVERIVGKPVLQRLVGGARGGGSHPSEAGMTVLRRYRRVEALANKAAKKELGHLLSLAANKKRGKKS